MLPAKTILRLQQDHDADFVSDYARRLLGSFGLTVKVCGNADHPALSWRRSGLMALTGKSDGPPLMCPGPLAGAADGALLALKALASPDTSLPAQGSLLLGERARLLGLTRDGPRSPNGSCRLLTCRDGAIALNLARPDDWDLLPALFGRTLTAPDWDSVASCAAEYSVEEITARAASMGMAVGAVVPPSAGTAWFDLSGASEAPRSRKPVPRVVDFSALWAGPLAGALLADLGAEVVKVESAARPDGARHGNPEFFHLLNRAKQHLTLDFADRSALAALVATADIVIEGSRPRALRHLGIDAEAFAARGGLWISITGHGRTGPAADRAGFGDDAAVAGGLAWTMAQAWGEPLFAGDAVADPLTGIHAALAGWALWQQGRCGIVALSLAGTVGHMLGSVDGIAEQDMLRAWQSMAEADTAPLYPLRSC